MPDNKFDANSWDKSPSYQNGGDVPWSRGIDLTPEQKMIAGKNIGIVTDAQIDSLIDQFHDLDGRVNVAIDNVDTALETVSSLSGDVESALTGAQHALDTVNTITANFDVLSGKVDSNAANISSNSADISTNSSNIGTLSAKEQIDRTDINAISGNVGTNAYNIGNLSAKVNTISGNVSTLQSDVSSIKIDITGMNSRLNTVSGIADNALASGQDALNKANSISAQWTVVSGDIEDLKDDWSAFSATEDAVITAATAAIPGQISAEVSGQLSGKQDKLTPGVNISLAGNVIDVKNNTCSAGGNYAIALGYHTNATAYGSFAEGANTRAYGQYSHAGGGGTSAIGDYAHSEGSTTLASGAASHAEGYQTQSIGQRSHAEGWGGIASGNYSHVEGYANNANGGFTHAEGSQTTAAGQASHTEGNTTYAAGVVSHAEGGYTSAISYGSHTEGLRTITDTEYQHVEGRYNAPATGALHVIGNGTSTANRSNIVETYTSSVNVNGNLNVMSANVKETLDGLCDVAYDVISGTKIQFDRYDFSWSNSMSADGKKIGNIYAGITYSTVGNRYLRPSGADGSQIGIVKWDGNCFRTLAYNSVSSFPDTLPKQLNNFVYFAVGNSNITSIPSAWNSSIISASNAQNMFGECTNLSGDYTSLMDDICTSKGTTSCPGSHTKMFINCTAVTNYSTLTADPKYSGFFV